MAHTDARKEERVAQFRLLAALLPYEKGAELRLLELGSGHGLLTGVLLETFPRATVLCVDFSPTLIAAGKRRLAAHAGRFEYLDWDLSRAPLPIDMDGPFHAIATSRVVHMLEDARKAQLYREMLERLLPGGCFVNVDHVRIEPSALRRIYYRAEHPNDPEPKDEHHAETVAPFEDQLQMLRDAGFDLVDLFWKRLDTAMFGGFRPAGLG
jgi:SAM-dependent methyltransferase